MRRVLTARGHFLATGGASTRAHGLQRMVDAAGERFAEMCEIGRPRDVKVSSTTASAACCWRARPQAHDRSAHVAVTSDRRRGLAGREVASCVGDRVVEESKMSFVGEVVGEPTASRIRRCRGGRRSERWCRAIQVATISPSACAPVASSTWMWDRRRMTTRTIADRGELGEDVAAAPKKVRRRVGTRRCARGGGGLRRRRSRCRRDRRLEVGFALRATLRRWHDGTAIRSRRRWVEGDRGGRGGTARAHQIECSTADIEYRADNGTINAPARPAGSTARDHRRNTYATSTKAGRRRSRCERKARR